MFSMSRCPRYSSSVGVLEDTKPGDTRLFNIGSEWSTIICEIDNYKIFVMKK